MDRAIIKVEKISKRYGLGARRAQYATLREAIAETARTPFKRLRGNGNSAGETLWALKDVSFEIFPGEVVGMIGRNGAGKSTLLKILSRITRPSSGRIELYGRVGSLLEVGTGFHPELTGRENIFLNGAILGMSTGEIRQNFDEIVVFAEVEKFLDTPVKHYSSGMYVRLAFAVAAHLSPEILIVDEVLAVGDLAFQKKCLGKMEDVASHGRTVLFVSHNMAAVRNLCSRAFLLQDGKMTMDAETEPVIREYLRSNTTQSGRWARTRSIPVEPGIYFERLSILDSRGEVSGNLSSTEPFTVQLEINVPGDIAGAMVAIRVTNDEGVPVFTTSNCDLPGSLRDLEQGRHVYRIRIPGNFLRPGRYSTIVASMVPGVKRFDVVKNELGFLIEDVGSRASIFRDGRLGVVTPQLEWEEIEPG